MLAHLGEHLAFQYRQTMQSIGQQAGMGMELPLIDFDEEETGLSPDIENALSQFEAQSAQLLAQSQPPSEDEVKQQQQNAKDQAELQLKAEELNIRKARFQEGVKKDAQVQDRLTKEFQLKALKMGSDLKRKKK
jgi:erythromycin esterase-like protein